ncbi:uncharacterized protein LOC103366447 isoform X5 [Stegastes partitus]|uniref:Uncharacterized protein LOC103366447 isoform X5 n=1 Tax=Stegastes partitus TaxID=144197 RepID=A0A9Y4KCU4_9TELE|nr:PREDICTED: uncharacterized protein LOC103366447 isoform X5 [Stegastes partitus]
MTTTTATVTMMMMMMMMMVVVCVSAASLGGSRRVETNTTSPQRLTENQENVSTGLKSHQDANETLDDSISVVFFRPEPHEDVNKTVVDATRIKSHQDVNETLVDPTRDSASNSSRNETSFTPLMFVFPLDGLLQSIDCPLPTCLTVNLGSTLQRGDEKAGDSTRDPFGVGKK